MLELSSGTINYHVLLDSLSLQLKPLDLFFDLKSFKSFFLT